MLKVSNLSALRCELRHKFSAFLKPFPMYYEAFLHTQLSALVPAWTLQRYVRFKQLSGWAGVATMASSVDIQDLSGGCAFLERQESGLPIEYALATEPSASTFRLHVVAAERGGSSQMKSGGGLTLELTIVPRSASWPLQLWSMSQTIPDLRCLSQRLHQVAIGQQHPAWPTTGDRARLALSLLANPCEGGATCSNHDFNECRGPNFCCFVYTRNMRPHNNSNPATLQQKTSNLPAVAYLETPV